MRSARPSSSLAKRMKLVDKLNRSKKSVGFLRGHQSTEFFKAVRPPLASGTIRDHDRRLLLGELPLMLFVHDRAIRLQGRAATPQAEPHVNTAKICAPTMAQKSWGPDMQSGNFAYDKEDDNCADN